MRENQSARPCLGASLIFTAFRRLERILSPTALHRLVLPLVSARVAFKRVRSSMPLPGCLGEGKTFQISSRQIRKNHLNVMLEFFPDRLGTAKWRDRLRISGVEHLETARQQKRPVILALCHFGPYFLLRHWLRAAGFPAVFLVGGESRGRSAMKRLADRISPFPEIPTALYRENQLRGMIEFVAAGNPLLIAVDVSIGKQMEVAVNDDWQVGMASGAVRLAMRQQAELIPCSIIDEGNWHFQIKLSPPVPQEIMRSGDTLRAGKHILDALLPDWRAHPEQCTERLVKLFRQVDVRNNPSHEFSRSDQFVAG
jgi:lauroyl/myristoyl acyltransferase